MWENQVSPHTTSPFLAISLLIIIKIVPNE